MKKAVVILWPSFLAAGVAEVLFFTLFDPSDLGASRMSAYSASRRCHVSPKISPGRIPATTASLAISLSRTSSTPKNILTSSMDMIRASGRGHSLGVKRSWAGFLTMNPSATAIPKICFRSQRR